MMTGLDARLLQNALARTWVEDPESVYFGKRMKNGWKDSGLPWASSFDPEKILIGEGESKNTAPERRSEEGTKGHES